MNKTEVMKNIEIPKTQAKNSTLTKKRRALVVIDLAKGNTLREIAKEYKIGQDTITKIQEEHKELIEALEGEIVQNTIEQRERIIYMALEHLEAKLKEGVKDSTLKVPDLLETITKMKHDLRLDTGKATAITHSSTNMPEQIALIKQNIIKIEGGDKKELLGEIFTEGE